MFIGYNYKSQLFASYSIAPLSASKGPSFGLWLLYKKLLPLRNAHQDFLDSSGARWLMLLCKIRLTHFICFCSTPTTAEKAHLDFVWCHGQNIMEKACCNFALAVFGSIVWLYKP